MFTRLFISAYLLLQVQPVLAINYFRCETTQDCVKAYGGCGRYLSVHRRYKELYEAKAHGADKVANCLPPTEKDKLRKFHGELLCQKQSCRLLLPNKITTEGGGDTK